MSRDVYGRLIFSETYGYMECNCIPSEHHHEGNSDWGVFLFFSSLRYILSDPSKLIDSDIRGCRILVYQKRDWSASDRDKMVFRGRRLRALKTNV